MSRSILCLSVYLIILTIAGFCSQAIAAYDYLYEEDFEDQSAQGWAPRTPLNWKIQSNPEGGYAYHQWNTTISGPNAYLNEWSIYDLKTFTNMTYAVNIRTAESLSANPVTEIGIIFCYQNENNFYYVSFSSEDNATVLLVRKNGQDIVLARTDVPVIRDYDYISVAVTVVDGVIKVSTEDYNLFHIYDNTFTSGKIGVGVADDAAYFDKVIVCKEVENTCDYYENFNDNNLNGWTALDPANWICSFKDYTYVLYLTKAPENAQSKHLGEIITLDNVDAENFTLEFDLKSILMPDTKPNADLAVVWCYLDAKNYYAAIFHRQGGETKWVRIVNDNVTTIRQCPEALLIDQEWHHVKITAQSNYYKIYFDDKLVM
ncbi:hypothetical protein JW998_02065, partial [candidate division KSB1 bacterium]|nr:hypothetical protein [candidate division KSB1 bacterium]